jgi:hypothetical protein
MENMLIHLSQLIPLHFIGQIKKEPNNLVARLRLTKLMQTNMVSFGKDQVSFQDSRELFGELKEYLLKYQSKVHLEIAGSFPLLQLLLKFHQELKTSLLTLIIHLTELSKLISTSMVRE